MFVLCFVDDDQTMQNSSTGSAAKRQQKVIKGRNLTPNVFSFGRGPQGEEAVRRQADYFNLFCLGSPCPNRD
jgi:hypothetical protein